MEKIILKSSQISDTLARSVSDLRAGADLIDVTLVSGDGKQFGAHRVILAAQSSFFKSILTSTVNQNHPLIYIGGVKSSAIGHVLEFLYEGKVEVPEHEFNDFLSFAKEINIKGLEEYNDESKNAAVYLPASEDTKLERNERYASQVDTKLSHIFQPEPVKPDVKTKETSGDLSQNPKWLERVRSQKKFCDECDYVTNGNSKLRRHKEVRHDQERREPVVCKTISCGKSFTKSSELREHREKCFMTCPSNACNSKFTIPESLEIHR